MTIEQQLIEQKLFELIEVHDFDTLSTDERLFVLRQTTEEEYKQQRLAISLITEAEQEKTEFIPSQSIAQNLFKEEKTNWLDTIKALFDVRVPALALALPVLLLVFFFFFDYRKPDMTYSANETKQLDTLLASVDTTKQSVTSISVSNNPYSKFVSPMYQY